MKKSFACMSKHQASSNVNEAGKLKEVEDMGAEAERQETRKAMAYDLHKIIDREPAKENYTKQEIKKLIDVYVETANQT